MGWVNGITHERYEETVTVFGVPKKGCRAVEKRGSQGLNKKKGIGKMDGCYTRWFEYKGFTTRVSIPGRGACQFHKNGLRDVSLDIFFVSVIRGERCLSISPLLLCNGAVSSCHYIEQPHNCKRNFTDAPTF
jgi:hypothetical protein